MKNETILTVLEIIPELNAYIERFEITELKNKQKYYKAG